MALAAAASSAAAIEPGDMSWVAPSEAASAGGCAVGFVLRRRWCCGLRAVRVLVPAVQCGT